MSISALSLSALSARVGGVVSINVALSANGGVADAAGSFDPIGLPAASTINGEVDGNFWGSQSGGWSSFANAPDSYVEITFSQSYKIRSVVLYTLKDDFNSGSIVTDATTFSLYGVTGFDVLFWNGSTWETGASITGNTLVRRSVPVSFTTDRIRILFTSYLANMARCVEIQAFT